MSQQTNLNVAPYFDDFDAANDYHKILFKPGYPVQARELTGLQSILQNQIEKFGQHFFKEGAKVIPGNIGYNSSYYCIQLQNNYLGIPVSAYVEQLLGTKISGETSGVSAVVDKILLPEDSERGNLTLYINYLNSSLENNSTQTFSDGENITCNTTIESGLLGNSSISAGTPFATTLVSNAAQTGSSFQIQEGIYFIHGNFVNVKTELIILDQYTTIPSYRIGLFVNEEIINSDLDESLNDNSQGYNNYSAPGADRFKISVRLFKKSLTDYNDNQFVELAIIEDGTLKTPRKSNDLGGGPGALELVDMLASRTYAESGDYYVKAFSVSVLESLNNGKGNGGVFEQGQLTYGGKIASENSIVYKFPPGRALVRGYDIETLSPTFIDVVKPRTTKTLVDQSINYNTGPTLQLNRTFRSPSIGIGNTYVLSLRSARVGLTTDTTAPGTEVGIARVYDYRLESGSYNTSNSSLNEWNISLYDIQPITSLTLNQAITLSVPTFVKGSNSGATGFLKNAVSSGTVLSIYEVQGEFVQNESLEFDGISNGRIAIGVSAFSMSDVKSVYGPINETTGLSGIGTFSADVVQSPTLNIGIATISATSGSPGVSTVKSTNSNFPGIIKIGNILQFSQVGSGRLEKTIGIVESVGRDNVVISQPTSVPGIYQSFNFGSTVEVNDLQLITTKLATSSDDTLYTPLPKENISDIDLTNAQISIRKTFTVNIASGQLSSNVESGVNETFLPFDDERYALVRSDGTTEALSSDKISLSNGSTTLQIYGLGGNDTGSTLITTLRKAKPKSKVKIKNLVKSVLVDKSQNQGSGAGSTTLNNGLTYGNYPYGTRVQDNTISLNSPDIIQIHAIFESEGNSNPSAPKINFTTITSNSTTIAELSVGESFIGNLSGANAIIIEKIDSSKISYIYKNATDFKEGETVTFQDSGIQAEVSTIESNSFDISSNFTFNSGQQGTFYDQGFITRKKGIEAPSKKIKIYFSSGSYESTDTGDFTTVDSYRNFNYSTEIQSINSSRNTDIIDIRPRVSDYTVAEGTRSPLEFYGRNFDGSGNSAANILASNESFLSEFTYYLGRIDRVFLNKYGKFQIIYGDPAESPQRPNPIDDGLEIAEVNLPPYLYNVKQASLKFLEHKRYQMKDIRNLDTRIKNLEYYTSLSLLEINTSNLLVPDSQGNSRFKSGFFVDNFESFKTQEDRLPIKNSIDRKLSQLRPRHYTNAIDLIFGPVTNRDPSVDLNFASVDGINVRKTNDIITLDYGETEYIKQIFATRTESVTPFMVSFWQGTMELNPASDTWVDTVRLDAKIIDVEGNYSNTMEVLTISEGLDPQTGFGPIIWDSWETNWTGFTHNDWTTERSESNDVTTSESETIRRRAPNRAGINVIEITDTTVTTTVNTIQDSFRETTQTDEMSRDGTRTIVTEQFDTESIGDKIVSRDLVATMRSRNIEFISKRMKPLTRLYAFFDGQNVSKYCVPKLLEVTMTSGAFQIGEKVTGFMASSFSQRPLPDAIGNITFRVAQHNHREGPYNAPTAVFRQNPYDGNTLGASYGFTSTILNVDTFSLSNEANGEYRGFVESGMTLKGETSGAEATITQVRLITDLGSNLTGSFYIPNPNNPFNVRFETGSKTLTLINEEDNNQDICTTICEEAYASAGTLETIQENINSIRNARIETRMEFAEKSVNTNLGTQQTGSTIVDTLVTAATTTSRDRIDFIADPPPPTPEPDPPPPPVDPRNNETNWSDPLAQSFLVEEQTGVFITKVDIFLRSKDDMDIPLVVQLRTMQNGYPTTRVLPFSEVVIDPADIILSDDGSIAQTIEFKSPVYLSGGTEYSVCLLSNSTKYSVYISRIGENDILSDTFISNQPYLGSLFKSQNASTWEPSQWEDLKFTLYKAQFLSSGSVDFYSPELSEGNRQIPLLQPNSLNFSSRQIRVGLATTSITDSGFENGNTFFQVGTNATGNLVGTAGTAAGTLSISNAGIGLTPTDGSYTFSGVNLISLSGNGRGAVAQISIKDGVAVGATVSNAGGSGYQVGDVLGINTIGAASVGKNLRLTVAGIGNTSELILNNVQGNFIVAGAANSISYIDSVGIAKTLNQGIPGGAGGNIQVSSITEDTDGLHIKVNHRNHGMYAPNNKVIIKDAISDVKPARLSVAYDSTSTGGISVSDGSSFGTFENVSVGTTNTGYLRIGKEIIEYSSVNGNVIGGNIVRNYQGTSVSYPVGTPVFKYELNGVNLLRINKTHLLSDSTVADSIAYDSYNVKLDMSEKFNSDNDDRSNDVGWPKLFAQESKSTGGFEIKATQNMPFEIITPNVHNMTISGTSIKGEVRTVTGKSISGKEIPFIDVPFEPITFNQANYLDSTRLICSKVNEEYSLANIEGGKSLQMRINLSTLDRNVSPVLDAQRINTVLSSNRVNSVIQDYSTDPRANTLFDDPSACQYISKEISLENSATSLKILLNAHINDYCDIRVFYAISDKNGFNPIFIPFPGYLNLDPQGQIIDKQDSDGRSDTFVTPSSTYGFKNVSFRDYSFTADDLPSFRSYRIKIILTGTNQTYVPRVKDLRVLALA
jgi:hypothetical protein